MLLCEKDKMPMSAKHLINFRCLQTMSTDHSSGIRKSINTDVFELLLGRLQWNYPHEHLTENQISVAVMLQRA